MNRDLFDALIHVQGGPALLWGLIQTEREAAAREREAAAREAILRAELERSFVAVLQHKLDLAQGHATVRSVLEQIVLTHFPGVSVTEALKRFCALPRFLAYLDVVSDATKIQKASLIKSAKGAYSLLSEATHNGRTSETGAVPQAVMPDKSMLYAVSAIFKLERRNVRFYLDNPGDLLDLPSPESTPPATALSSAISTPQRRALSEAGGGEPAPATASS